MQNNGLENELYSNRYFVFIYSLNFPSYIILLSLKSALAAASYPLLPAFVPALSIARSMLSVAKTPDIKVTGTFKSR